MVDKSIKAEKKQQDLNTIQYAIHQDGIFSALVLQFRLSNRQQLNVM